MNKNALTQAQRKERYQHGRTGLPLCIARSIAPFAPPLSEIHRLVSEADKVQRETERAALLNQINWLDKTGAL